MTDKLFYGDKIVAQMGRPVPTGCASGRTGDEREQGAEVVR
jgi:hypothetical protein